MDAPRHEPGELVIIHNDRTGRDGAFHVIGQRREDDANWIDYEVVNGGTLENPWSGAAYWDEGRRRWLDGDI